MKTWAMKAERAAYSVLEIFRLNFPGDDMIRVPDLSTLDTLAKVRGVHVSPDLAQTPLTSDCRRESGR